MSNDVMAIVVTLERDWAPEHAEKLVEAIKMLHGVASVKMLESGWEAHSAREQARVELVKKLWEVLK